jgi:hypothetical protein
MQFFGNGRDQENCGETMLYGFLNRHGHAVVFKKSIGCARASIFRRSEIVEFRR